MTSTTRLVASAGLALGLAGINPVLAQQQQPTQQQQQQQSQPGQGQQNKQSTSPDAIGILTIVPLPNRVPQGMQLTRTEDAEDIRDTLAEVTDAAVTRGGFDDLVAAFVDFDRNRIGDYADRDFPTLNGRIAQIRQAWQNKYGHEPAIEDEQLVFGSGFRDLQIVQGQIANPVLLAANWPVDPTPQKPGGIQRQGVDLEADADWWGDAGWGSGWWGDAPIKDIHQKNLEQGREVAIVSLPAQHGLPALDVSLIDEAFGWKVDVPDNVSGREVRRKLLNHLTYFGENVNQWPADEQEAYRQLAHHVLMATYGLDVPAYSQQQQQQQTQPPQGSQGQQ